MAELRAIGLLVLAVALPVASRAANEGEPQPRPRDAAQAVQEGSVMQWLDHYQRERGEAWSRSQAGAPAQKDEGERARPQRTEQDEPQK